MSSTTTRLALVKPVGADAVSVIRTSIGANADTLDSAVIYLEGVIGSIPAAGIKGRMYRATDTGQWLLDTGAAWVETYRGTVTALPSSPIDGQVIHYLADATNGVVWQLRYRAASASSYKWEFIGGSVLSAEVAATESTGSAAFVDLTTVGPSITVPLAGDYELVFGSEILIVSSSAQWGGAVAPKFGAAAVTTNDQATFAPAGATGATGIAQATVGRSMRRTVAAAATVVKLQYARNGADGGSFARRNLAIRPIRVG